MAMPVKQTMSELEIRCARLLGFGAMGGALKRISPIIREHLMMAHTLITDTLNNELERKINRDEPGATVPGQTLYDVPDDCDPQEVKRFRVADPTSIWRNLKHGIDTRHRRWEHPPGYPRRYDVSLGTTNQAQFEIWPEPDSVWALELEYWRRPGRFTEDNDPCTVDELALIYMAVANLKNHYSQDDAEAYSRQYEMRIADIKSKQHGNKKYKRSFRNDNIDPWSQASYDETSNTGRVILHDSW